MREGDFFRPKLFTLLVFVILFVFCVPFLKLHEIQCIMAPCVQPSPVTFMSYVFYGFYVTGINYLYLLVGIIFSYFLASGIVFYLKKYIN